MSYMVEPVEADTHSGLKWPYYVKINGVILRKSNGTIQRFKDSISAACGGAREVDRLKRLAVTMASRMPEASDCPPAKACDQ